MKASLVFVPPGGGETEYDLDADLPGTPRTGDYISILGKDRAGTEDFIVRRNWWHLDYSKGVESSVTLSRLVVECEFAGASTSSDEHKQTCKRYHAKRLEVSAY
jgi:hypothetical protein